MIANQKLIYVEGENTNTLNKYLSENWEAISISACNNGKKEGCYVLLERKDEPDLIQMTINQYSLRKYYDIDVTSMPTGHNEKYFYEVRYNKSELLKVSDDYETYEDALRAGIEYAETARVK